ncbi:response regulator [Vibrio vulnificus]|uniref:Response regulator n=1 Tax=Vibrio vulnificus TaxID=672 RepID=A0ABX4WS11_VIBVL|nr:response regulator [Vibrio vulnificus]ASJ37241.1 response regulator [Vibrio vulnificus]ASM96371.1 response regulator [Vibrio vulnificus NBRC 15645 = ATCC 27562]AUL97078.1 Chemotaxis regulator - transmits chemoreceptor signals to flagelllar motor components CheY [Vibrio vulnificus]EGQ7852649.1 response regulator [Vibrio vulnificus]EGQ7940659.1 response regulator [Vibrio vulnificus]
MKILIVDDSKATLEIVRKALLGFGYRRLSIEKTNCALAALEKVEHWRPDIVLTDWHMPDMSGLELVQTVATRFPEVKIAMITTVDDDEQIAQAKAAGASFVLSKPFDDDALHRKLLPLVQGAEESEKAFDELVEVQKELALPKLSQLEKLLQKVVHGEICLANIRQQQFDESKIPCMIAIYEDGETQKPRAVAVLDIYAVCVLASANMSITPEQLSHAIHKKMVSKTILDTCQMVLDKSSLAFLDSLTRKSLRLKSVSFVPEAFDKLKVLFSKPADKRLDFSCQLGEMAQGKITLVGF